jgi:hypothetical protein
MTTMTIEPMLITKLRSYPGNSRTHSRKQIKEIAASIQQFGFTNPVLIGDDGEIIAGHGRVEAAKLLGLESVPTVRLAHLDPAQRRAYVIADNKLALNAGWDHELLAIELQGLIDIDFDVQLTGFSLAEIDIVLDEAREGSPGGPAAEGDGIPALEHPATAVTRTGDVWCLGRHRLICGDSRNRAVFDMLMGDERADLIFTDPPLYGGCCQEVGWIRALRLFSSRWEVSLFDRGVSSSRPSFGRSAARRRGQGWPQATAGGGAQAALMAPSTARGLRVGMDGRGMSGGT